MIQKNITGISIMALLLSACTTLEPYSTEPSSVVSSGTDVNVIIEPEQEVTNVIQEALADAIEVFSADIEELRYYRDLASREPLLDDDHRRVLELTTNIEDAIELFALVLDVLL